MIPKRAAGNRGPLPYASFLLEFGLVDLVLGDLVGDASPGQAGDLGALSDVAPRLAQGFAQVAFLERGGEFGQLLGERAGQIDLKRMTGLGPAGDVPRQV